MKMFHLNSASPFIVSDSDLNRLRLLEPDSSKGNISFEVFDTTLPKKPRRLGRLQGCAEGIILMLPDDLSLTSMGKPCATLPADFDASKGILKHHLFGTLEAIEGR